MSTHPKPAAHDQKQGPDNAPHILIEYGDYQCPPCGQAAPILHKLVKHLGEKLQFVFRNYPLDQHEFARPAAETALFAAEHGKFWEMHDLLYKHQAEFSEALFPKLAGQLKLDPKALIEALESGKYKNQVKADIASGDKAGVQATPSLFLDGNLYEDALEYAVLLDALKN